MIKIGRNDPCPCGSGSKYKKCCIDSGLESFADPVIGASEPTYDFLMQHNSIDLLKTFAGLSIIPENHGKYFRLEELVTHTLLAYNDQSTIATTAGLKLFLDNHFAEESMEDICVNPFTDLITFYGGDYLTFPGITENGQEILTNQLTAIFQWPYVQIRDEFKTNVKHVVKLGLAISDEIAKRLGYNRYMDDDNQGTLIEIPSTAKLDMLKRALIFTTDEMMALMEEHHIVPQALVELLLDRSSISKHTLYTENNPIHYHPIIKAGNEYIVLSPATICLALTDIIWHFATQWDVAQIVNDAYHDVIWNSLQLQLGQVEFKHADVNKFNHESGIRDGMYTFDSDKIAYIAYIGDNNGQKKLGSGADRTQLHRADSAIKALTYDPRYCNHQCLALFILSGIGRTFYYPLRKVSGAQTLVIPAFDIETLWLHRRIFRPSPMRPAFESPGSPGPYYLVS